MVFTQRKKPVAALVSLKNVDPECLALATNPEFAKIIQSARREIQEGKTISLDQLEKNDLVANRTAAKKAPRKAGRKGLRSS